MYTYIRPPGGDSPCEATGEIDETGQEFYFRLRSGKASLCILKKGVTATGAPNAGELHRVYCQDVKSAGSMQLEQADFLISWWVKQYLKEYYVARFIASTWFGTVDKSVADLDLAEAIQSLELDQYSDLVIGSFDAGSTRVVFGLSQSRLRLLSETAFSDAQVCWADVLFHGSNVQITVHGNRWWLQFRVSRNEYDAQRMVNIHAINSESVSRALASEYRK